MRRGLMIAGALALAVMAGCIVNSLNPLFEEADRVFNPKLVGEWKPEEGQKDSWTFQGTNNKSYELTVREKGKTFKFGAALGTIGDAWFLDIIPVEDVETFSEMHMAPTHSFMKAKLDGDRLELRLLSHDWFKKELKAGRIKLPCVVRENDRIILTASTKELQAFMLKHADNAKAFPDAGVLLRVPEK